MRKRPVACPRNYDCENPNPFLPAPTKMDYTSAFTYLPALFLVIALSLVAGASCLMSHEWSVAYLIITVFAANALAAGQLTEHWAPLTRGIAAWLAWVAYGDMFAHTLLPPTNSESESPPVRSYDIQLAPNMEIQFAQGADDGVSTYGLAVRFCLQIAHPLVGLSVGLWRHRGPEPRKPALLHSIALFAMLMYPLANGIFPSLSCPVKVLKSATFAALYGFNALLEPDDDRSTVVRYQVVSLASIWPLFVNHLLLPISALQVLARLYDEGVLEAFVQGADDSPAREKEAAWQVDLDRAYDRAPPPAPETETAGTPDLQRLIAMSNGAAVSR